MKKVTILPKEARILKQLGENIKLARMRRKLTAEMLAERANIGRSTLWSLETGKSNTSLHTLLKVLSVLGMEKDLGGLAIHDELGRKLEDAKLAASQKIRS